MRQAPRVSWTGLTPSPWADEATKRRCPNRWAATTATTEKTTKTTKEGDFFPQSTFQLFCEHSA